MSTPRASASTHARALGLLPSTLRSKALTLAIVALAFAGCVPIEGFDDLIEDCQVSEGTAQLAGTWKITGQGSRTGCLDERFNAEKLIINSKGLSISQQGNLLTLSSPLDNFTLSDGNVTGTCVNFNTVELADDPAFNLLFSWDGNVRDDGVITGSFRGEGPSGCESTGTFSITVQ